MITKKDMIRLMVETSTGTATFEEWCDRNEIDCEDLTRVMAIFAEKLWTMIADMEENEDGVVEAQTAMVVSHCMAATLGIEIGRQFPVTPFNEQ